MMPVQKLDDLTVSALGASLVLTDPASLVKELIDNSLDACATAIFIEISPNTLESIQVRDNGHGVPHEDRDLLVRRNCTSKITCGTDLEQIRGSSLGFRGQALASIAESCGSLSITTRVKGEDVASVLTYDRKGNITSRSQTSCPIGTIVKIVNFCQNSPVRRRLSAKNADSCLRSINQCLRAYSFARPNVRFTFRVLQAKNEKVNFTYAPTPSGNIKDVTVKLTGPGCASQCTPVFFDGHGFTLSAFLPRPDAQVVQISGHGAFLSVDGRPISASNGTLKEVVNLFRDTLKSSRVGLQTVKDPFLFLAIACSSLRYDSNIEPAKDDVLFGDPEAVVAGVREMFGRVYSSRESTTDTSHLARAIPERVSPDHNLSTRRISNFPGTRASSQEIDHNGFECSIFADSSPMRSSQCQGGVQERGKAVSHHNESSWSDDDSELGTTGDLQRNVQLNNPWILAKLNTTVKSKANPIQYALSSSPTLPARSEYSRNFTQETELHSSDTTRPPSLLTPRVCSPAPVQVPSHRLQLPTSTRSSKQFRPPLVHSQIRPGKEKAYPSCAFTTSSPPEKVWFDHLPNPSQSARHTKVQRRPTRLSDRTDQVAKHRSLYPSSPPQQTPDIRQFLSGDRSGTDHVCATPQSQHLTSSVVNPGSSEFTWVASSQDTNTETTSSRPTLTGLLRGSDSDGVSRPDRQVHGLAHARGLGSTRDDTYIHHEDQGPYERVSDARLISSPVQDPNSRFSTRATKPMHGSPALAVTISITIGDIARGVSRMQVLDLLDLNADSEGERPAENGFIPTALSGVQDVKLALAERLAVGQGFEDADDLVQTLARILQERG